MADDPSLQLRLHGRPDAQPALPPLLQPQLRSATPDQAPADAFLPPGYLKPLSSYDVGATARSGAEGRVQRAQPTGDDEIVVLELEDGSTFIGNARRLHDALQQTHPEMVSGGQILLEKLRADAATPRGFFSDAVGGLVRKVYTLVVPDQADDIVRDALQNEPVKLAELGVSWLGTKALMAAVESRLQSQPGRLCRWSGQRGDKATLQEVRFHAENGAPATDLYTEKDGQLPPMLVFIHGTASNTQGSFGDLRESDRDLWGLLERRFGEHIYAFEHRTLSESPIRNALALLRALPQDARVCLVTHSRGGLVGDLLCLDDFGALIDTYAYDFPGTGAADPDEAQRVIDEMRDLHGRQRQELQALAALARQRRVVVQRYVRVASPANGTRLASANFDLFLSGLLTLIGLVPYFFGNPFYAAFKRVVVDIAKNRTDPHLVPGIEAMLPDSPLARLLREAPVRPDIRMAVIAGDIEGGNLLSRLGVLLTDFVFFDNTDNDLVVDTVAMLSGVAPKAQARVLFDRGRDVSHFRYFGNLDTRSALRDWLVRDDLDGIGAFSALPSPAEYAEALAKASVRDAAGVDRPVVVVLPGVMGSHLRRGQSDRVWFDPLDIASGGLAKIAFDQPGIEAEELFSMFYGQLCRELSLSHRVERFAYDWRQPLDVLAERFGAMLDRLLRETTQPIRLLAHSMGGLVVRATIHKRRPVMDALMQRDGARLVMLGTPHQGAHSMVENLIGKGDTLRTLVRLDLHHDMQQVLDIVAGFRGALQLLPKPGFKDMFQGEDGGGQLFDYQDRRTWVDFRGKVRDFWFGDGRVGQPSQDVLDQASWLWSQDGNKPPALPEAYAARSVYVFGLARNTPCGVREDGGRLKMVGTTRGDGTVTWASGRIGGIGSFYYMPAEHGDLTATPEHFDALVDLLTGGSTARLSTAPPAVRAIERPEPVRYDAGPPSVDDVDALQRGFMGGSARHRVAPRAQRRLEVAVHAMDLRFVRHQPILVGHYEQDPIAGPQSLIDRELLQGVLSERFNLGLYTGPLGTATSVLCTPNAIERASGHLRGAIVTGLGPYDGALSQTALTEAVRTGVLRYLLQTADVLGRQPRELRLATLLLGYNSSANMTIVSSVESLVRGVLEANAKFRQTTGLDIRVTRLDIVELYLDTAITAVYALRAQRARLQALADSLKTALVLDEELHRGDGLRQRLFEGRSYPYWPRLMITDADAPDDCAPAAPGKRLRIATRLRFLYVGQRARAESVQLQRQPELIEKLVRQQIASPQWQEDFGRMLFQLMVPHDFKDAARELERVVLVVDRATANLPWELMLADDPRRSDDELLPLALRTAVVRQLASASFRRQVRESVGRDTLVIGNPSLEGFVAAFPGTPERPAQAPDLLPGAEAEARGVAQTFKSLGYTVEEVIGADRPAKDVLAALYRKAYRFLHISAHGVFDLQHADGERRSGVLLSDGLLITAAEIASMESVPELVFLNCCHLGKIEFANDGNKLAASVARELIEIGVRCVVVAGWAVSDDLAQLFGQTLYEQLLLQRRNFGEAVFEARKRAWRENAKDITWGAFQAYGDPGWLAEPRAEGIGGPGDDGRFASPEELLDSLARIRADLKRRSEQQTPASRREHERLIDAMLKNRCPPGWLALPQLQSVLGAAFYDLQLFERARTAYLRAVQIEDSLGQVPIRDIERLANIEARLGAARGTLARPGDGGSSGEALIRLALARLEGLDQLIAAQTTQADGSPPPRVFNTERSALRGSAHKRLAELYARQLLQDGTSATERETLGAALDAALAASAQAYADSERDPASGRLLPYPALNRLALQALLLTDPAKRQAAIEQARQCAKEAAQQASGDPGVWPLIMQPEAQLIERLFDDLWLQAGEPGQAVLEALRQVYAQVLDHLQLTPAQLDSVVAQMEALSRFADALRLASGDAARARRLDGLAGRLLELVLLLLPNRPVRQRSKAAAAPAPDAPAAPAADATPDATPDAAPAPVPAPAARKVRAPRTPRPPKAPPAAAPTTAPAPATRRPAAKRAPTRKPK